MNEHRTQPTMKMVFHLATQMKSNPQEVERIQCLTLNSNSSLGMKGTFGLYGTPKWWDSIQGGSIRTRGCTGIIYRVYFANGSDDFDDLMMDIYAGGLMVTESCYSLNETGYHLFRPGHRVEFRCAYDELKTPRPDGSTAYTQSMLEMSVSDEPWPGAESIVSNLELSKIQKTFLLNP